VKLLRGTIAIDLSRVKMLSDKEIGALLRSLVGLASEGYRVLVSKAPFNANVRMGGGRVYRVSISHGAFIIHSSDPRGLGEAYERVCRGVGKDLDLCWVLAEDVWADLEEVSPEIAFESAHRCQEAYVESVKELGYKISERSRSRIMCLGGGESISIDTYNGYRYLLIPAESGERYKSYTLEKRSGYRHPISVILSGRVVQCGDIQELELPEEALPILRTSDGLAILYGLGSSLYAIACAPHPSELLYKLAVLYISSSSSIVDHMFG